MARGEVNNLSNWKFWMSKWICNIQLRVSKEENKNNWNEFGRNILCPFLSNMLQICAVNEWGRYWIFFSFFRESVYCGFVLLVWTEDWLQRRRESSIESAANACEFMLCVEGVLSHEGKVNWLLLVVAVATVGWQSLVTRQVMDIPTANYFVPIWLPQHYISREIFLCVFVLWFWFVPLFGSAAIPKFPNRGPK